MKKCVLLALSLFMSAALLMGCTAAAQSMEAPETYAVYAEPTAQPETAAPVKAAAEYSGSLCTDADCNGGESCDPSNHRAETQKNSDPCKVCGDDHCNGSIHCSSRENTNDHHTGRHHGNHHNDH